MNQAGYIYEIKNTDNGHCYIGSTVNPKSRWTAHRTNLRGGRHHSFVLQRAWNKYGESKFQFNILLRCDKSNMIEYEKICMSLQSYNVLRTPLESPIRSNWKRTPEICKRISDGVKKAMAKPEARDRVSMQWLGVKRSKTSVDKSAKAKWKPVYCPDIQVTFLSQKHAAEHLGLARSTITEAIKRKGKVSGLFTFARVA